MVAAPCLFHWIKVAWHARFFFNLHMTLPYTFLCKMFRIAYSVNGVFGSANQWLPFASIADAKEGMCVLLDALNTCQHKSYPKGQLFNRSKLGTCPIHIIYIVTWCVDRRGSRFQGLVKPLAKCLKTCTFFMTFMLNSQALILQSTIIDQKLS